MQAVISTTFPGKQLETSPAKHIEVASQPRELVLLFECGENAQNLAVDLRTQYRVVVAPDVQGAEKKLKGRTPDLVVWGHQPSSHQHTHVCMDRYVEAGVPLLHLVSPENLLEEWDYWGTEGNEFIVSPVLSLVLIARVRTLLRMKRQSELLRDRAELDPITLVASRLSFEQQMDREWRAAQRQRSTLGLVLVSVDHFEGYVRQAGHAAGEDALREVAQVLSHSLRRPRDFLARYGRQEFAVLLPGSDEEAALAVASYLCQCVSQAGISFYFSNSSILSLSAGASSLIPDRLTSPRNLTKAADDFLYVAMMSGRNQARNGSHSTKPPVSTHRALRAKYGPQR